MEVAIACVQQEVDLQIEILADPEHLTQRLCQSAPRNRPIHGIVIQCHTRQRPCRALARIPYLRPLGLRLRHAQLRGPVRAQHGYHLFHLRVQALGIPIEVDDHHRTRLHGQARVRVRFHQLHHPLAHHLHRRGHQPPGNHSRDCLARLRHRIKGRQQRLDRRRIADQPHLGLGHDPQRALAPCHQPHQVQLGIIQRPPA